MAKFQRKKRGGCLLRAKLGTILDPRIQNSDAMQPSTSARGRANDDGTLKIAVLEALLADSATL
jgi:hypothetical protein